MPNMEQMKTFTVGADTWEIVDGAAREEIADARTGADGTEYESLGAAIRGATSNAVEILKDTVTGNTPQTVDDAFNGYPLLSAAVDGKAVQDGTPTPDNPIPVQVVSGRNLFNPNEKGTENARISTSNGSTYGDSTHNVTNYIKVFPNSEYALSVGANSFYCWYDSTKKKIFGDTWVNEAVNRSPSNAEYIRFDYPKTSTEIQLEAGTTATPYVPYGCIGLQVGENVVPIDLQGNTLAALPDGTKDVLTVDSAGHVTLVKNTKTHVFTGSENVGKSSSTTTDVYFWNVEHTHISNNKQSVMCNAYKASTRNTGSTGLYTTYSNTNSQIGIVSGEITGTNAAEFKQMLANNGVEFLYGVSPATTIDLGTIEMPELLQECTLAIYAALDPDFSLEYRQDLNIVINQLKEAIVSLNGTV